MSDRLAYPLGEAAAVSGQKLSTLRRAINTTDGTLPRLPAKRVGRGYTILRRDLEAWLQQLPDA